MFSDYFRGKKVLITGNTGFKGSWLTIWLLKLGANVYGISKDIPSHPAMFEELSLRHRISHEMIDVRDLEALSSRVSDIKPDIVFHLAAQPIVSLSYLDPLETLSSNIIGTANVLEALRRHNHPCNVVVITSDKCYDNVEWAWGYRENDQLGGKDIYSASKGAAELITKSYFYSFFKDSPVRIASARAGNVVGGGDWACDRIIPDCMRAWNQERPVEIRSPGATRPWQHVLEPLGGYLTLAKFLAEKPEKVNGESFNFGPRGEYEHSVLEILSDMSKFWNFDSPASAFKLIGDIQFPESGLLKLNCDKALSILKWTSTYEYEQMIEAVSFWYYRHYQGEVNMFDFSLEQIKHYELEAQRKGLKWIL